MNRYIALINWTEQGVRTVKDVAKRADGARVTAEKLGGKFQIWFTMGQYDAVAMVEMPNDEAYNRFALQTAAIGNVRTKTLKAWTLEEMSKTVAQI